MKRGEAKRPAASVGWLGIAESPLSLRQIAPPGWRALRTLDVAFAQLSPDGASDETHGLLGARVVCVCGVV